MHLLRNAALGMVLCSLVFWWAMYGVIYAMCRFPALRADHELASRFGLLPSLDRFRRALALKKD
jgi:hypothetical protein